MKTKSACALREWRQNAQAENDSVWISIVRMAAWECAYWEWHCKNTSAKMGCIKMHDMVWYHTIPKNTIFVLYLSLKKSKIDPNFFQSMKVYNLLWDKSTVFVMVSTIFKRVILFLPTIENCFLVSFLPHNKYNLTYICAIRTEIFIVWKQRCVSLHYDMF